MNGVANLSLAAVSDAGSIAFIDLKAQQRRIRANIEARIQKVLDHGRYIGGPEIDELEDLLQERTGARAVTACASGTAALIIPLVSFDLQENDAVFIPAFTYNATANAVLLAGGTPVFVDIDPATFNMDPVDLERRIDAVKREGKLNPRIIIPVDLFGSPADYPAIDAIAAKESLRVLSDGAQSFGAQLGNRWVGNLASATATSFFPGKALGAYGDAGAIFSQNPDDKDVWESIRWHGTCSQRKESIRVGFNGRMDSFQAAVLLEKLAIFDEELAQRHEIAKLYAERLDGVSRLQDHHPDAVSSFGYYSLCVENRDEVAAQLKSLAVPTAIYYTTPLHKMPAFEEYAPEGGLPATESVANEILSIPMHPYLTPDQVDHICASVVSAVSA